MAQVQKLGSISRGAERERALKRPEYFSNHYFSMVQLTSHAQQIHDINALNPVSVLEIGIGNGFTSSFLRLAGHDITTADINDDLEPDYVAPLAELPGLMKGRQFDLVACCEVLEHMPWDEFENSISTMRQLSPRLYLTLPNYAKFFGFSGFLDIPRIRRLMNVGAYLPIPRKISPEHFWEVGTSRENSARAIKAILRRYYPRVRDYSYRLNRYHHAFVCESD